jgi:uncharacterized membrane protein YhhN
MLANILTVAALISSLVYIATLKQGGATADPLHYALKPLTTLLIAGIALALPAPISDSYRWLVVLGLLLSLAGDVFLMLPNDRYFLFGLASFLVAHLFFIGAYRTRGGFGFTWWLALLYLAYAAALVYVLWPSIAGVRIPVMVYASVLMVMGWQAAEMWLRWSDLSALFAMLGAILFLLSDSALALNKFRAPIRQSSVIVMSTYWAAQLLIAWSVRA